MGRLMPKLILWLLLGTIAHSPVLADAELPLRRTEAEHIGKNRHLTGPSAPSAWIEPSRRGEGVVYRFAKSIDEFDPIIGWHERLSYLCRAGQFGQVVPLQYRVVDGDGRVFGLAFGLGGSRSNLHDPGHASRNDQLYLFEGQDTPKCSVWAGLLGPVRELSGLTAEGRPPGSR